jgi:hypothetical protein
MNVIFASYLRIIIEEYLYQPVEPEYEVCCRVSETNESQTSYSVEQADIFQYQSYSHSDDMFIILKSNINMDIWYIYRFRYLYLRGKNHIVQNIYPHSLH